jgi:hypothetical protein
MAGGCKGCFVCGKSKVFQEEKDVDGSRGEVRLLGSFGRWRTLRLLLTDLENVTSPFAKSVKNLGSDIL